MYICICNSITDTQIRAQVKKGRVSLDHIRNTLKVATVCGQCQHAAQAVIDQTLMQNKASVATQFIPQVA